MTRHTRVVESDVHRFDQHPYSLTFDQPRRRRPTPPALLIARAVYATVLASVLVGLPPLLRTVGTALQ